MENEGNTRRSKRIRKANSICEEATRNDERIREFVDVKVKVENFEDEFNSNTSTFQDAPDDKDYVKSLIEERGNTWDKPDEILCRNTELPKTSSGADMFPEISDIKKECDINTEDLAVSTENYSFRGDIDKNNVIADINHKKAKLVNDQCGSPSHTGVSGRINSDKIQNKSFSKSTNKKTRKTSKTRKLQTCECISKHKHYQEVRVSGPTSKICGFRCRFCEYTCRGKYRVKIHLEKKHPELKIQRCGSCFTLLELKNLEDSMRKHTCNYCDFSALRYADLLRHIEAVHMSIKGHKCNLCNFSASRKGNLKEHMECVHLQIKNFKCDLCDYRTGKKQSLKKHIHRMHSISWVDSDGLKQTDDEKCEEDQQQPKCSISISKSSCVYGFEDSTVKKEHVEQLEFQCDKCTFSTTHENILQLHIQNVHLKGVVNCPLCRFTTQKHSYLKVHMKSVHFREKHCHLCSFSCESENKLQQHIDSVHIQLNFYKCSKCDFTAYRKTFLQEHNYNCHSQIEKCEGCKVSFESSEELQRHMTDCPSLKITN